MKRKSVHRVKPLYRAGRCATRVSEIAVNVGPVGAGGSQAEAMRPNFVPVGVDWRCHSAQMYANYTTAKNPN